MNGRVLSEEDKDRWIEAAEIKLERLESTIRDRDKTIAELMSAVELMAESDDEWYVGLMPMRQFARNIVGKFKSSTVSKQEESTVSEVACEQTTKDSLHVARQNTPTHPMEQINRLAQEVADDMRWREGERT